MNPSVDVRIAAVIRTMETIVMPALHAGMAKDQAALVVGHLRVLRDQADFATRYELLQLCAARSLARQLMVLTRGGECTMAAVSVLADCVTAKVPSDARSVRDCYARTVTVVEDLVRASGIDGERASVLAVNRCIMHFGKEQALRDRAWFSGMGFESFPRQEVQDVMNDFDARFGDEGGLAALTADS